MRNYEYIIASLPELLNASSAEKVDAASLILFTREQLSEDDCTSLDLLLRAYDSASLDADFYLAALRSKSRFLRNFLEFDLDTRNVKVEWLNSTLSRPEGQDIMELEGREDHEFEDRDEVLAVLSKSDLLQRERGIDDLYWSKIDSLTIMELFSLDAILALIAKLKIIDRWQQLDPETGRQLFRRLVQEIRATYDKQKNNNI